MPDEHIKELLLRIEGTLKNNINDLKHEVEVFQERTVTRKEYDNTVSDFRRELDRIERRVDWTHEQWKEELSAFKKDLKDSHAKAIALTAVFVTILQVILMYVI